MATQTSPSAASPAHRPIVAAAATVVSVLKRDILVLAWYLLLALWAVSPMLSDPRQKVLGELTDNVHYVYVAGWSAQALFLGKSPFIDPRLNYPDDLALGSNDSPYLSFLLVAPVTLVFGPVAGYNLMIVLSHVLSGYCTYLWARRVTGHQVAAVFAGTAFMLTPFRIFRSLGHANLVSTQMMPLFFWALDNCVSKKDTSEFKLWMLGLAVFLVASSSQYLLIICLVTGALYALGFLLPDLRFILTKGWRIVASVIFGAMIGSLPAISVLSSGLDPFNIGATRLWSADPLNFLLPSSLHPIWGAWVNSMRPEPYATEKTLYVSLVALVVAGLGLAAVWRRSERKRLLVWALTALGAAIFALGTDLWLNNQPLSRSDPFWLPVYYLAKLPLLNIMRVWSRFGIVTILFVALASSFGVRAVLQSIRQTWLKPVLGAALLLVLLIDLMPGTPPASVLQPRPIDRWLAQQAGDFAVALLPVDKPMLNDLAIFGSLFHGKQMPAYLHNAHQPRAYKDFAAMALDFPSADTLQYMRWRKFKYIILDKAQYNGWRAPVWAELAPQLARFPELTYVTEVDGYVVLALRP